MNFLDLQNLVVYWLDDLEFGYFTRTQVKLWLNNAQKEVQKKLIQAGQNFYLKCVQTDLVINQADYVLPEDFKDLNRLEVIVSGTTPNTSVYPVTPITLNQQDLVTSGQGTPSFYYLKKNRLVLQPLPNVVQPLRLWYSYAVADMVNDSDVPDVPEDYTELIALYAAQDGFIKDGRASDLLNKRIADFEKRLEQDSAERTVDMPRQVVDTGNFENYGFMF